MFVINLYSIIYLWLKFFCKNIPCCRMLTNGLPLGQGKHFFKLLQSYSWINQVWCDFEFFLSDLWPWLWLYIFLIKFIHSEKATKVCKISAVDLSYVITFKSTVKISQNCVVFSEYMNFNKIYLLTMILSRVKIAQLNILAVVQLSII